MCSLGVLTNVRLSGLSQWQVPCYRVLGKLVYMQLINSPSVESTAEFLPLLCNMSLLHFASVRPQKVKMWGSKLGLFVIRFCRAAPVSFHYVVTVRERADGCLKMLYPGHLYGYRSLFLQFTTTSTTICY